MTLKEWKKKKFWFFVRHYIHSMRVMDRDNPDTDDVFIKDRYGAFICAKDGAILEKQPTPVPKYRRF